jgi:acyl carrier protein
MENDRTTPLSFDQFQSLLAEELMLPAAKLTEGASLLEDLHVDSLAMVSMMLKFEDKGVVIPMEQAWELETVGDVYQAYIESTHNMNPGR